MKHLYNPLNFPLATFLYAAADAAGSVVSVPAEAKIKAAVAAVRGHDYGQSRKPLLAVENLINQTHGNAELRAAIEEELVKVLESEATLACKQFVCQKLWIIGTRASVPALAEMLGSANSRVVEAACYALSRHPSPAVSSALRDGLNKSQGSGLAAVINLLADRRDSQSAGAIAKLTQSADAPVADAAIAALGKIATENAAKVLADLRKSDSPKRRIAANHAYLQCAQELEARGKFARAKSIYEQLAASGESEHVRRGARIGLAQRWKL